jgi:hypothetical protein
VKKWLRLFVALTLLLGAVPAGAQYAIPAGEPVGLLSEPLFFERTLVFVDRHMGNGDSRSGIVYDYRGIPSGSGVAGGMGYRWWANNDRRVTDGTITFSSGGDRVVSGRVEWPSLMNRRLIAGSQVRLQQFRNLAVYDAATPSPAKETYDLNTFDAVGYATLRLQRWMSVDASLGWLAEPDVSLGPAIEDVAHTGLSFAVDTRDLPGHPLRGGLYRVSRADYFGRNDSTRFTRYEAEAAHFVPVADGRVVLGARGWIASTASESGVLPFYFLPSLGGDNSLRGFTNFRFRDRALLLVNAEARLALLRHLDAAVFVDAGSVAARTRALGLDERSYGFGFRIHSRRDTFGRLDIAHSREGWRAVLKVGDALNPWRRTTQRAAVVPFEP